MIFASFRKSCNIPEKKILTAIFLTRRSTFIRHRFHYKIKHGTTNQAAYQILNHFNETPEISVMKIKGSLSNFKDQQKKLQQTGKLFV